MQKKQWTAVFGGNKTDYRVARKRAWKKCATWGRVLSPATRCPLFAASADSTCLVADLLQKNTKKNILAVSPFRIISKSSRSASFLEFRRHTLQSGRIWAISTASVGQRSLAFNHIIWQHSTTIVESSMNTCASPIINGDLGSLKGELKVDTMRQSDYLL